MTDDDLTPREKAYLQLKANIQRQIAQAREAREQAEFACNIGILIVVLIGSLLFLGMVWRWL